MVTYEFEVPIKYNQVRFTARLPQRGLAENVEVCFTASNSLLTTETKWDSSRDSSRYKILLLYFTFIGTRVSFFLNHKLA